MFVCKECHKKTEERMKRTGKDPHALDDHRLGKTKIGILYGPCEYCGKMEKR